MSDAPVLELPTLLLAEDEALLISVLEEVLIDAGFEVVTATTGAEALSALEASGPTFCGIVTDIRLGSGASGWDLGHRAREINSEIAVVYMSGDSAKDWASNGVPNSIMLSKPFAHAQLITAIAQLLNSSQGGNDQT